MLDIFKVKAKNNKSLIEHSIDTFNICKELLKLPKFNYFKKRFKITENICDFISLHCLLHDIGKCHPFFQLNIDRESDISKYYLYNYDLINHNYPSKDDKIRHEVESVQFIKNVLKEILNNKALNCFCANISDHHIKLNKNYNLKPLSSEISKIKNNIEDCIYKKLNSLVNIDYTLINEYFSFKEHYGLWSIIQGFIYLSDWLASDENNFNFKLINNNIKSYNLKSNKEAKAIVKQIFNKSCIIPNCESLKDMFNFSKANEVQEACEKLKITKPSLYIIESTMGTGKTEMAQYLTSKIQNKFKLDGYYFALPTNATSNQMYERNLKLYKDLEMRGNLINIKDFKQSKSSEKYSTNLDKQWNNLERKGLLTGSAIGTVDQLMMSSMYVKYNTIRLLALTSKVVIIDEVHAYDTYMMNILKNVIEWCGYLGTNVILLSATLPEDKKVELIKSYNKNIKALKLKTNYPLITQVSSTSKVMQLSTKYKQTRKVKLNIIAEDDKLTLAKKIKKYFKINTKGVIILNSVKRCHQYYNYLKNKFKDVDVKIFHSRYLPNHRKDIEIECLKDFDKQSDRNKKTLLVATQVVEQSLDLDFDFMFTDIAPIDLIFQRSGRLQRHYRPLRTQKPEINILAYDDSIRIANFIYLDLIIDKSLQTLKSQKYYNELKDIPKMVKNVYNNDNLTETQLAKWVEKITKDNINIYKSNNSKYIDSKMLKDITLNERYYSEDFASTRLQQMQTTLTFMTIEQYNIYEKDKNLNKFYANQIKVPLIHKLNKISNKDFIVKLEELNNYIILVDNLNNNQTQIEDLEINYNEKTGLEVI